MQHLGDRESTHFQSCRKELRAELQHPEKKKGKVCAEGHLTTNGAASQQEKTRRKAYRDALDGECCTVVRVVCIHTLAVLRCATCAVYAKTKEKSRNGHIPGEHGKRMEILGNNTAVFHKIQWWVVQWLIGKIPCTMYPVRVRTRAPLPLPRWRTHKYVRTHSCLPWSTGFCDDRG